MKTVQIDCVLEFSFEGNLTKGELVAKAIEALENASNRGRYQRMALFR